MPAAQELHALEHPRLLAEEVGVGRERRDCFPLRVAERLHLLVDARDGDRAVVVHQAREDLRQRHRRVGDGTAPHPAVHGLLQRLDLDVHDHDAAQGGGDAREPRFEVSGIGQHDGVGPQHLAVLAQEVTQGSRPGLLLAFDDHLHVHRHSARGLQPRLDRGDVHEDPCLVVRGAASPQPPVLLDRIERLGRPLLLVARRLHVVMRVEKERRPARRLEPLAVCVRVGFWHLEKLDVVHADPAQQIAGRLAALAHLLLVEPLEGNAGNADELLQLLDVRPLVLLVFGQSLLDGGVVDGSELVLPGLFGHAADPRSGAGRREASSERSCSIHRSTSRSEYPRCRTRWGRRRSRPRPARRRATRPERRGWRRQGR